MVPHRIRTLHALLPAAIGAAALAALAHGAGAAASQMVIAPAAAHVKNGKIALTATCSADASACSGVILGRLPLARRRGSALDPGSLGGPFFSIQPNETMPVVFKLTPKTTAFLKLHPKTTLTVTVKLTGDDHNELVSAIKLPLYR